MLDLETIKKFVGYGWNYKHLARHFKKSEQVMKSFLQKNDLYFPEHEEVYEEIESVESKEPKKLKEEIPHEKSLSQGSIVDHTFYASQVKKQKKPVYTPFVLPPFELREDHWMKPFLNKEIFINQNTPIEEVL